MMNLLMKLALAAPVETTLVVSGGKKDKRKGVSIATLMQGLLLLLAQGNIVI